MYLVRTKAQLEKLHSFKSTGSSKKLTTRGTLIYKLMWKKCEILI